MLQKTTGGRVLGVGVGVGLGWGDGDAGVSEATVTTTYLIRPDFTLNFVSISINEDSHVLNHLRNQRREIPLHGDRQAECAVIQKAPGS